MFSDIHAGEAIAELCGAFVLFCGDGVIEFAHQSLDEHLAIDGSAGAFRAFACVMGSAVLGAFDEAGEFGVEGLVALGAADAASLAELGETKTAAGADFVGGLGGGAGLFGSGWFGGLRDDELREELVDGLLAGQDDACFLGVEFAEVDFFFDAAAHGDFMNDGGLVAEVALHLLPYGSRPLGWGPSKNGG